MEPIYICITSRADFKNKFIGKYDTSNRTIPTDTRDYPYLIVGEYRFIDNEGYRPDTIFIEWSITKSLDPEIVQFAKLQKD